MKEILQSKAALCVIATVCLIIILKVIGSMTHNAAEYIKNKSPGTLGNTDFEIDQTEKTRESRTIGQISNDILEKRTINGQYR